MASTYSEGQSKKEKVVIPGVMQFAHEVTTIARKRYSTQEGGETKSKNIPPVPKSMSTEAKPTTSAAQSFEPSQSTARIITTLNPSKAGSNYDTAKKTQAVPARVEPKFQFLPEKKTFWQKLTDAFGFKKKLSDKEQIEKFFSDTPGMRRVPVASLAPLKTGKPLHNNKINTSQSGLFNGISSLFKGIFKPATWRPRRGNDALVNQVFGESGLNGKSLLVKRFGR